ncbi:MAG: adaptor protein MecA [Eubacteriales bacterium]|nr:adaptor protein MecA [Eubacteriales bacterium]
MKIERISENSIRCTLTGFDLSVRNLNIKELAYGSEKARKLFNEMMAKASKDVGFEAENTPIMIEAIPLGGDSIQLVITKVEDPEELDTRFSKFSPMPKGAAEDWVKKLTSELLEGADGLLRQMQQLGANGGMKPQQASRQGEERMPGDAPVQTAPQEIASRVFAFDRLDRVIEAAAASAGFSGCSRLYKKPDGSEYILVIENREAQDAEFAKVCNTAAEYGRKIKAVPASLAYFEEHYDPLIKSHALQKLSRI